MRYPAAEVIGITADWRVCGCYNCKVSETKAIRLTEQVKAAG